MKQLLLESVIVQGLVTLTLVGTVSYLAVVGQPVPETIVNALMIVIGFWFGSKAGLEAGKRTIDGQQDR